MGILSACGKLTATERGIHKRAGHLLKKILLNVIKKTLAKDSYLSHLYLYLSECRETN